MKKLIIGLLICLFHLGSLLAQDVDSLSQVTNQSEVQPLELQLNSLEKTLSERSKALKNEIELREENLIDRLNLYVGLVIGFLSLVGFGLNFFGRKFLKNKIEDIVENRIETYTERKIDSEIEERVSQDYVDDLINDKAEAAISLIIEELEKKGNKTIKEIEKSGKELINQFENYGEESGGNVLSEEYSKLFQMALSEKDTITQIKVYNKILEEYPKYLPALNNLGNAYRRIEEYDKAIELFNKAIEINNEYVVAYGNRAITFSNINDLEKAIEDINVALNLAPNDVRSLTLKGSFLLEDGRKEGEGFIDKALEIDDNYSFAYLTKGDFHLEQGDYEKAISFYKKAFKNGQESVQLFLNWGVSFRKLGKYQKAFEQLNQAQNIEPNNGNVLGTKALIYADKGDDEKFYFYLERALEEGCSVWNYLDDEGFDKYRNHERLEKLINQYDNN